MPVDANGVLNRRINELLFAVGRNRDRAIHDARRFTAIDELSSHGLLHYCAPLMSTSRDLSAPDITATIAPKSQELPIKTTAFQPSSTIGSIPTDLPAIARTAPLPAELNETFRGMVFRSGRSCLTITWVNRAHVSLVCDRKLRVAFIQEPQGWRLAGPRE